MRRLMRPLPKKPAPYAASAWTLTPRKMPRTQPGCPHHFARQGQRATLNCAISRYCNCSKAVILVHVVIASIGDLLLDIAIVPDGLLQPDDDAPATITLGGGGQAANFCAWVAAEGEQARLMTRVGDDETGRRLVADLEARGVEVCVMWAREPTGVIVVLVDAEGRRTMATQRGASVGLTPEDLEEAWLRDVRLLHVPAYSLFVEPLASAARAAIRGVREGGGMLSVDLSSASGLRTYGPSRMAYVLARLKPELLFASKTEAETLAVALDDLAQVPVLKLGADGCQVFGRTVAAPWSRTVDPTGAGDALAAAFCVAWLKGATPLEAAQHAVSAASHSVTLVGARPS